MQVFSTNNSNSLNFKALRIAKAKNCHKGLTTHIDIYRLTESDNKFLEKLLNNVDFRKLLPSAPQDKLKLYQDVFRASVFNAMDSANTAYVAVSNNLPCGLLALRSGKIMNFLDLVSIPVDMNTKVNMTGQILLYQGFLDSQRVNANKIKLEAINGSLGNPVQKYKEWGLEEVSEGERYVEMQCDKLNIEKQLKRFAQKIKYKKVKSQSTNLESFIA